MRSFTRFFSSRWGPVVAGATIGMVAALLVWQGNPKNMGLCMGCFTRDTAGALGLHRAVPGQYIRPEIVGLILGALLAGLIFREFRVRSGSAPLVRFVLGFFSSIGALVFLGCPWRAYLRLSGGDWNALVGLVGLVAGIWVGALFLKRGFELGRNNPSPSASGWAMPVIAVGLLALLLAAPQFGKDATGQSAGPVFFTPEGKGPGSAHAPWALALGAGLLIGFLAQRSRFCTVGALRDLILLRDPHLFYGVLALLAAAFGSNLVLNQFRAGFEGQPIAHAVHVWNFLAMVLSGLCFTLAGGCPGRQIVLAGEGDGDAGIFFFGALAGAAMSHNFSLAAAPAAAATESTPAVAGGPGLFGQVAVVIGLVVCIAIGLLMREPAKVPPSTQA
jgi:uncharacterized protein